MREHSDRGKSNFALPRHFFQSFFYGFQSGVEESSRDAPEEVEGQRDGAPGPLRPGSRQPWRVRREQAGGVVGESWRRRGGGASDDKVGTAAASTRSVIQAFNVIVVDAPDHARQARRDRRGTQGRRCQARARPRRARNLGQRRREQVSEGHFGRRFEVSHFDRERRWRRKKRSSAKARLESCFAFDSHSW